MEGYHAILVAPSAPGHCPEQGAGRVLGGGCSRLRWTLPGTAQRSIQVLGQPWGQGLGKMLQNEPTAAPTTPLSSLTPFRNA